MKSGKDGSCPVCGRMHDQDCHWYSDNQTVLCYTKGAGGTSSVPCPPDSVPAAIGGNYVFKEMSSDGRAGIYSLRVEAEVKAKRPASKTEYSYDYADGSPAAKVIRTDFGDGTKKFAQLYFDPEAGAWEQWVNSGKNAKGNIIWKSSFTDEQKDGLKSQVPLYNLPTVMAAIADGKDVWFVEGEGCVDVLAKIDIVATTLIAGAGKLQAYNPKAIEVLHGARVILCPDRDQKGLAHMEEIAEALKGKATVLWCYCKPELSAFWINLQKDGGLDCKDWLDELGSLDSDKKRGVLYDAAGLMKEWVKRSAGPTADDGRQMVDVGRRAVDTPSTAETATNSTLWADGRRVDAFSDIPGSKAEIEEIESKGESRINLSEVLPEILAAQFNQAAAAFPTRPEAIFNNFLPVAASQLGTSSILRIRRGWDAPAVLWSMLVAKTGAMKTPTLGIGLDPLVKLQAIANQKFKNDHRKWTAAKAQWDAAQSGGNKEKGAAKEEFPDPEPVAKHFWINDATMEKVGDLHASNTRGLLLGMDEIDGLYKNFDQYRNKGGGDEQNWLSMNGGGPLKVDRMSRNIFMPRTAISITGTIQPATLEQYLGGGKDTSGMNARWLYFAGQMPSRRNTRKEYPEGLGEDLEKLYTMLQSIKGGKVENYDDDGEPIDPIETPRIYEFSEEAYEVWCSKWEDPINARIAVETHEGMNAILCKYVGFCARIALVLHLVEWSIAKMSGCNQSEKPSVKISAETIQKAIKIGYFYVEQAEILYRYAPTSPDDATPAMRKLKEISIKLASCEKVQGWITPKIACQQSRLIKNAAHAKTLFFEMASAGFGVIDDSGRSLKWKFLEKTSTTSTNSPILPDDEVSAVDTPVYHPSTNVYHLSTDTSTDVPADPEPPTFKVGDPVTFDMKFWSVARVRSDGRLELKLKSRLEQTALANPADVEPLVIVEQPYLEPDYFWVEPVHDASFGDADDVATAMQDRICMAVESGDSHWISQVRSKYRGLSDSFRELVGMGLDHNAICHLSLEW